MVAQEYQADHRSKAVLVLLDQQVYFQVLHLLVVVVALVWLVQMSMAHPVDPVVAPHLTELVVVVLVQVDPGQLIKDLQAEHKLATLVINMVADLEAVALAQQDRILPNRA